MPMSKRIFPGTRLAPMIVAAALLSGCLGGLSGRVPDSLLTLSTAAAPPPADTQREGRIGDALVVVTPTVPQALRTPRIPVYTGETAIAYVQNAQWVEPPARLFQRLLTDTIDSRGRRLVINESENVTGPGEILTGELSRFDVNADALQVVIVFTAMRVRGDGTMITRQRFEVREGISAVEPAIVGAALNRAANTLAADVAAWVG
jgi:cholesterol transport system auxiliary component